MKEEETLEEKSLRSDLFSRLISTEFFNEQIEKLHKEAKRNWDLGVKTQ